MSNSNNLVDNWVFCSPDAKYGGILVNVSRADVKQAALMALTELNPDGNYDSVKYTRYRGSSLFVVFEPDDEGIADCMLSDESTTKALYDLAGWPLDLGEDDGDDDDGDDEDDSDHDSAR